MKTIQSKDINVDHWLEVTENYDNSYNVVEIRIIEVEIVSLGDATDLLLKTVEKRKIEEKND